MATGIDNIKKDIKIISDAVKQSEASFKDGFQFTDLFSFVAVLSQIPEAINAKDQLIAEIKDLTQDEVKEIVDYVSAVFTISNKKLEQNIKDGVAAAFAIITFVKGLKA